MRDQLLTNNLTGSFEVTVLEVAQYTKGLNIFYYWNGFNILSHLAIFWSVWNLWPAVMGFW